MLSTFKPTTFFILEKPSLTGEAFFYMFRLEKLQELQQLAVATQ